MIWIVLFALSAIGFITYIWRKERDVETAALAGVAFILPGGFFMLITLLLVSLGVSPHVQDNVTVNNIPLAALADGNSTGGRFFLGIGNLGRSSYYTYYAGTPKTGYKQYTAYIDRSVIFEDATNETAYVKEIKDEDDPRFWYIYKGARAKYEFHIPAGSILRNYQLDLE